MPTYAVTFGLPKISHHLHRQGAQEYRQGRPAPRSCPALAGIPFSLHAKPWNTVKGRPSGNVDFVRLLFQPATGLDRTGPNHLTISLDAVGVCLI